jgi:uncharacterized membrane-anchored protein YitT (DUF2179 family)
MADPSTTGVAMQPRDATTTAPIGRPHTTAEDAYALVTGSILLVLGLVFLKAAGLVTGGIAGLSLLLSYLVPLPAGVLFTLVNIPFFLFADRVLGRRFALKTVLVSAGIAVFSAWARVSLIVSGIHPFFAALVGGTVIGLGILVLVRHQAGVGGTGVVTIWLHRTRGWNPGASQMAMDAVILALSIPVVTPSALGWSALSAVAVSLVPLIWHKPDRYIGHS